MRRYTLFILLVIALVGCHRSSRVNQYKAEKRTQDSVRLEEQVRSMTYYESQLETMGSKADSLLALFSYERNEKYQDHGYYVVKEAYLQAEELQITIKDIKELEKRILRTSLETQKYEKRLQKE